MTAINPSASSLVLLLAPQGLSPSPFSPPLMPAINPSASSLVLLLAAKGAVVSLASCARCRQAGGSTPPCQRCRKLFARARPEPGDRQLVVARVRRLRP